MFPGTVDSAPPPQVSRRTNRYLFAALLSAIVPGVGQLFLNQKRNASVLLFFFVAVLVSFWPLRLLRFYAGFLALFSVWIILYLYAACSAQLALHLARVNRPSRWWLVPTLPVAFLIACLLGAIVTRASGFRSFSIPSVSMERTIERGDHIVADMRCYYSKNPARQDLVIFMKYDVFVVKRVIAVGGDRVEGKDGSILLNRSTISEPYVWHAGATDSMDSSGPGLDPLAIGWRNNFGPVNVPPDKYFVMGDNRDVSLDSRSPEVGLIDKSSIVGKALYIFGSDRQGKELR